MCCITKFELNFLTYLSVTRVLAVGADTPNASLRILPGSASRPRADVEAELRALAGNGTRAAAGCMHAPHPEEVELPLDPAMTLVWNPSTWHATTVNAASGKRLLAVIQRIALAS